MATSQDYVRIFSVEQRIVQMQTEGLSNADALIQPQPGGNCMNWTLGHMVVNLVDLLSVFGQNAPIDQGPLARYKQNSEPVLADGPDVIPLDCLLADYQVLSDALIAHLRTLDDAALAREITVKDNVTQVNWQLCFLHFHHAYHLGQLEMTRQLTGHTEKII